MTTPERMTPNRRSEIEQLARDHVGFFSRDIYGNESGEWPEEINELLAELRAVEAERDAEIAHLTTALRDARAYMPTIIGNAQQVVADIIAALKEHDE